MTFSPTERLYSRMTGQLFSSRPSESIRPACVLPVEYSVARKRMPSRVSRLASISVLQRLLQVGGVALEF
jgi:hypothetical protein